MWLCSYVTAYYTMYVSRVKVAINDSVCLQKEAPCYITCTCLLTDLNNRNIKSCHRYLFVDNYKLRHIIPGSKMCCNYALSDTWKVFPSLRHYEGN